MSIPGAITAWGKPLLSALAQAVGVAEVAEVWIQNGDDGTEDRLMGPRQWRTISRLDPGDVVLVVGSAIPLSRTLHDSGGGGSGNGVRGGGEAWPLPDGEQRFKRLTHLIIKEPLPLLIQKVRPVDVNVYVPDWKSGAWRGGPSGSSGSR